MIEEYPEGVKVIRDFLSPDECKILIKSSEEKGFEQRFSFYKDYTGQSLLTGSELDDALNEIFERITQDIFNKSLANW